MSDPEYAVLGPPGRIRDKARFDDDALLKVLGQNSGNLVFQHAATRLFDAPLRHFAMSETPYGDAGALGRAQVLVFPAANHLRPGADWTGLNNFLDQAGKPLVVLGLGAQAPNLAGVDDAIAALRADAGAMRMIDILRRRALLVSVRGAFTKKITDALDLPQTEVLGCPSALINPDRALGAGIARSIKRLSQEAETAPILPAVAAAAPFEIAQDPEKLALERKLLSWAIIHHGRYIQQSGGISAMQATDGRWHRIAKGQQQSLQAVLAPDLDSDAFGRFMCHHGRFFTDFTSWTEDLRHVDLVIGTRVHGVMAALAAGKPGILIAHDSRTGELADTMHLPILRGADVMACRSLAEMLDHVVFDARRFDAWREATASRLLELFYKNGLSGSAHLQALARGLPVRKAG